MIILRIDLLEDSISLWGFSLLVVLKVGGKHCLDFIEIGDHCPLNW
jgi:hypothetical protein